MPPRKCSFPRSKYVQSDPFWRSNKEKNQCKNSTQAVFFQLYFTPLPPSPIMTHTHTNTSNSTQITLKFQISNMQVHSTNLYHTTLRVQSHSSSAAVVNLAEAQNTVWHTRRSKLSSWNDKRFHPLSSSRSIPTSSSSWLRHFVDKASVGFFQHHFSYPRKQSFGDAEIKIAYEEISLSAKESHPLIYQRRGCSSVVKALQFYSKDPGFQSLAGQSEGQFFSVPRVNSCADLFVSDPPTTPPPTPPPKGTKALSDTETAKTLQQMGGHCALNNINLTHFLCFVSNPGWMPSCCSVCSTRQVQTGLPTTTFWA